MPCSRERVTKVCERPQMTRGDIGESFVHAGALRCAANIRALPLATEMPCKPEGGGT